MREGEALPTIRLRARNLARDSENRIHDDAVARRFGFRGGLVPGITTFAYMTRPVIAALGVAWLERGTMTVRLQAPVYDGDVIAVDARVEHVSSDAIRLSLAVINESAEPCAIGTAALGTRAPLAPDPASYPEAALPASRPEASFAYLASLEVLGTVRRTFRAERAAEFLDAVEDDAPVYRPGPAHPGWIVYDANQVLVQNVQLGPWIHVGTETTHFSLVHDGDVVATRGRVAAVYERKGHHVVDLDLLAVASPAGTPSVVRPVWHMRHTAIFHIGTQRAR